MPHAGNVVFLSELSGVCYNEVHIIKKISTAFLKAQHQRVTAAAYERAGQVMWFGLQLPVLWTNDVEITCHKLFFLAHLI